MDTDINFPVYRLSGIIMTRIQFERGALTIGIAAFLLASGGLAIFAQQKSPPRSAVATPPELGRVAFLRDYAVASKKAKADNKPLLVLFDEVPGCATCTGFGSGPLSHPIVVSAAESEFVPLAVFNNVVGQDAEVLKAFNEPAWNNPVVRFLTASGVDLIPRKDGDYSTAFVLTRMVAALETAKRPVPVYLKLAVAEYAPTKTEMAVFAMYCYWEGEAKLGALDGVIGTRIGELGGSEVVEVTFNPTVIGYKKLVEKASELDCTHKVFGRSATQLTVAKGVVGDKAVQSDKPVDTRTQQQYHLAHYPAYYYLPLTAAQASRANAALAARKWPDEYLSPHQLELKKRLDTISASELKALKQLTPDRTPTGIVKYAEAVRAVLRREK